MITSSGRPVTTVTHNATSDAAGQGFQKVAIAVVHGIGGGDAAYENRQVSQPEFVRTLQKSLIDRFSKLGVSAADYHRRFVMEPVYWSPILEGRQQSLLTRMQQQNPMNWDMLRGFMVSFISDAIAYQISPYDTDSRGQNSYQAIHRFCAQTFSRLATTAGPHAPLCLIGHSLGSIVSYNYLLDLQAKFSGNTNTESFLRPSTVHKIGETPIERGETLSLYYTLGSPLALWTLRDRDGGQPIQFPVAQLTSHHPNLASVAEWVNIYDADDVIGYPLKSVNADFARAVKADLAVNAGSLLENWTPLSHNGYWNNPETVDRIARSLLKVSQAVNGR